MLSASRQEKEVGSNRASDGFDNNRTPKEPIGSRWKESLANVRIVTKTGRVLPTSIVGGYEGSSGRAGPPDFPSRRGSHTREKPLRGLKN